MASARAAVRLNARDPAFSAAPTASASPGVWEIVTAPRATAGSEQDRISAMADSVDRWDRDGPHPRHWAHWLDATYR